jgi:transposase
VDRGRRGSKHHLICCGQGNPLAVALSAGNVNDVTQTLPLVDQIPPVRGKRGRPRRRPRRLLGDRAYHSKKHRRELRKRGIQAKIAKPKSPHGSGLGRERWVVGRTLSWLHQYRRLRVRYERREDIHEAFLTIGCCLICFKALTRADALC